jgi:hypothetical protein
LQKGKQRKGAKRVKKSKKEKNKTRQRKRSKKKKEKKRKKRPIKKVSLLCFSIFPKKHSCSKNFLQTKSYFCFFPFLYFHLLNFF